VKPSDDLDLMSCEEIVDSCFDYLGGGLPERERRLFSSHLLNCPECMKFFSTYRKTPEVSRDALIVTMPRRVKTAVRDFLRARYEGESESHQRGQR
jgi:anti-sigma factor RsiW